MQRLSLSPFIQKLKDFSSPHAFIASGFYSGLSPFASGTTGSFAAVLFWLLISKLGMISSITAQVSLFVFITCIGLYSTDRFLRSELNSRTAARKAGDPGVVVIDEWSGMILTLLDGSNDSFLYLALAFFFFRLFDVLKPGPVNSLQKLPGTWGVMLDDVAAGFLALIVMQVLKVLYF